MRFYRLNDLPPGMWFDEAWSAVAARDTAAQAVFPPYFAASVSAACTPPSST
ncbi:MAG: hypothetical protein M5U34_42920 [Chloroflexi bacterium]|nr:hypothetical protein [Chloroflexota bacterium]